MIARLLHALNEAGVLGINSRNAEYIMRCNARSRYPLVDNKVLTKGLARQYGIPTPALYSIIENHGSLKNLKATLKDLKEFVVKPASGSGGSGIILIAERTGNGFLTQSGREVSLEYLSYHISDILSGIFSLQGQEDHAIIESLIHPDEVFSAVTYQGVPDVRIIVYRGVPVMAMVRLPTKDSDGKANLHRGAIGAGIELGTGRTITAVHKSQIVTLHPDTGNPVSGIQVPHWETMLSIAVLAIDMTGLCYVGVDIVIDRDQGPVLLELNARPGLAIQMANRSGLLKRLKHVDTAPAEIFATPEKRIAWAKENL
ncbi:MAG: alpha-L-glutamate ligase-like protein [Syntrophorhabdaceae bacterium]|jgi:alpha-L-glutamate ligase-like protein|nr:alpha-L-glutamate ligase-like protein [Syntrophorhabdaceae bacterium]MDD5244887.1 alpha-L-glutamate ligase-like protein [Syntrophorhabdaceae bacterium]